MSDELILPDNLPLLLYGRNIVYREDEEILQDVVTLLRLLSDGETLEQARQRVLFG